MIIDVLKQKFPQVEGLRVRDIVVDKADKRISWRRNDARFARS